MAKITVNVSQVQPAGGVPVTRENTKHSAFRDMPATRVAPSPPTQNLPVEPKMRVRNAPPEDPGLAPRMPVPPSSVPSEPPAHVTGSPMPPPLG